jgi:hypothetical protein
MPLERRDLATLRFTGPRFADHGLDLDVLPELVAYKQLLVETAKEIWRRRYPERQRLPRGFEESISIKFFHLAEGSTAVPLTREVDVAPQSLLPLDEAPDELDEAAALLGDAIESAGSSRPLPAELPRTVVPLFEGFGRTLRADESIMIRSLRRPTETRYDEAIRAHMIARKDPVYQDDVDIVGEVRLTDLDRRSFSIRLDTGTKVGGTYQPEQEAMIVAALGDHAVTRLRVRGTGEFLRSDGSLKQITNVDALELHEADETRTAASDETWLLTTIADIASHVPEEEWHAVPDDLARNLDRYLYGASRVEE